MGLFSRKKEEDLSRLPELPEMPGIPNLPELPSMPEDFQARREIQDFRALPSEQLEKSFSGPVFRKMTVEVEDPNAYEPSQLPPAPTMLSVSKAPVFIKLEKFQDSIIKFEEIKKRISEVDSALRKLKEVREKEEAELKSWELDLLEVKEKISSIDNSLFNKLNN